MKFHIAFLLLAVFGAAQAGKKQEVMTYGSGYTDMGEEGADTTYNHVESGFNMGSVAHNLVDASAQYTEQAESSFGAKSEALASSAEMFTGMAAEKRKYAEIFSKRARNHAAVANENYKKSQLYQRTAKDKEVVAKEYEERAQKHDRLSKDQDIKEHDQMRKEVTELDEAKNNLKRSNFAAALAQGHYGVSQLESEVTNILENHANALLAKAEEYAVMAQKLKEKANKDKENARIYESKAKEEEAKAGETEALLSEANKKLQTNKFYELEFASKAETEKCQADYARTRAEEMRRVARYNLESAQWYRQCADLSQREEQTFYRLYVQTSKESKMLASSATQLLKGHRTINTEIYSKDSNFRPNYHESY